MSMKSSGGSLLLVLLLSLIQQRGVRCQSTHKPVTALLHSKWAQTPFLLESSEFIASENGGAFWQFVEATKNIHSSVNTSKELYDAVLEQAEQLLSPMTYSLFIFSLSLHTHSPAVEMFNQATPRFYLIAVENGSNIKSGGNEGLLVALERLRVLGEVSCPAFVDVSGKVACSVEQLNLILQTAAEEEERNSPPVQLFKFDHRFPSPSSSPTPHLPTAVLYAQLGTPEFTTFHNALATVAREGRVQYVFRHFVKDCPQEKTRLSGYGVQLAVKNTEYKAVDDTKIKGENESRVVEQTEGSDEVEGFLFSTLRGRYPDLMGKLDEFKAHLLQGTREIPELKVWQLQDLGFQAAQRIMSASPDLALKVMKDSAQNLPMIAKSLSKSSVSKELRQEITNRNQKVLTMSGVQPGANILLLDGIVLQEESTDIFQMVDILLSETRLVEGLKGLGISPSDFQDILHLPVLSEHRTFAIDMRNESVVFINDLEKDKMYSSWPRYLQEFLRPSYPGMLKQIAKNVFNLVFCLNPATASGAEMVEFVKLFFDHMVPTRLGVLLVADPEEEGGEVGVALTRGFSYLVEHKSTREALKWLYQRTLALSQLNVSVIVEAFDKKYGQTLPAGQTLDDIFGDASQYDSLRAKSLEFFQAKGFDSLPQVLVNGAQVDMEEDLETTIVTKIQQQTFEVTQAVYTKRLKDSVNVYDYFLNKSNVLQRVNKYVVAKGKSHDLGAQAPSEGFSNLRELSPRDLAALLADNLHYFSSEEGEFVTKQLSVWVVADLETVAGREVARNALTFASSTSDMRVALVHNPTEGTSQLLARAITGALESQKIGRRGWNLVMALLEEGERGEGGTSIEDVLRVAGNVEGVNVPKLEEAINSPRVADIIASHVTFCGRNLDLIPGASALLSNGRLIGPLLTNETLVVADFQMLLQFEMSSHSTVVLERVGEVGVAGVTPDDDTSDFRSDLVMKVSSLLRSEPQRRRIKEPRLVGEHSRVHLPSSDPDMELHLVAYLDPLSPSTQRLAPLIQTLHTATSINVEIYLNPISKLSEIPIKNFYRYVLEPELSFEDNGNISPGPLAVFTDLPHSSLLTLNMDTPHSWLVEAVWSPHDLDNIHLEGVERGVHGEFELEHILVEGQCFDATTDSPTPGLEYVLGTASQPERFDTIVMANLGYFQLKAAPGAWMLRLREGRSSEIYSIASYYGGEKLGSGEAGEEGVHITVNSFRGAGVVVKVMKQPGMEKAHLLYEKEEEMEEEEEEEEEEEDEGALWETISSFIGGAAKKEEKKKKKEQQLSEEKLEVPVNETINIFSIASGHLYERFLRIMMLSVLKHTHNPVKFWFLKNYLSPIFKDFIPHMAQEYGFEYELVQYKWPRWLHAQTEKQRLIWGYKILFLDVLFPLGVKQIVFVDADQIVRADLRELLEIPLNGAPYAYTPFCDSRPEMAGFRFWDRGYWKNFLGNRKYHISALYRVDLKRFRQLAAGDRLRGQYQALSQDPNSLSNLDQDLPNNMIHSVPIYSLPQEWLWCETWCSNKTKEHAKTIDLCNNPLTKEPKLVSAMRIVPEWTSYDQEVRLLQERVAQGQSASPQQPKDRDKEEETEHRDKEGSASKHRHGEL